MCSTSSRAPAETSAAALVEHPAVDAISFTGSVATGSAIQAAAAGRVKRVSLELGGKSPFIVFPDADLETASATSMAAVWSASGQVCTCGTRVLVHDSIYDDFVNRIVDGTRDMRIGPGMDPASEMGPVVSAAPARTRSSATSPSARTRAPSWCSAASRSATAGYFHQPTVFTGVRNDMRIAQEEIFGPVMGILPFRSEDEAYAIANDVSFGLAAGVWTSDLEPGPPRLTSAARRDRVDQHVHDGVPERALRRRQAVRPRTHARRRVARRVHAPQERLDEGRLTESTVAVRWPHPRRARRSRPSRSRARAGSPRCAGRARGPWRARGRGVAEAHGRSDDVDLAVRPLHSRQVAVGPDGRVGDDLGVVAHRGEAQVGGGEELAPLGRGRVPEGLVEQREQRRLLLVEVERLGKLLGELRPADDLEERVRALPMTPTTASHPSAVGKMPYRPGTYGWPRFDGPPAAPVIRQPVTSLAWAQICPPSSDVSTRCPRPVRARATSAARMPPTRFWAAMWSAMVTPTGVGSPPVRPVVLISPPTAWALRSAPSRPASGPTSPNVEPAA